MKEKETGKIYAFSKGAPGSILGISSHIMLNHHPVLIDEESNDGIIKKNEIMARDALRCLGFSYRELTANETRKLISGKHNVFPFKQTDIEQDMVFLGLMGLLDPPREEVREAISLTRRAGIKVYIITGDHGLTAEAVAKQIGLISERINYRIVFGEEMDKLTQPDLKKLLENRKLEIIFARVSPQHKLRIVSALKELGEVVAVTGDGVNDAPALKRADIGVAMGIVGTDVSKEAANMVLSDDSFATIITAVKEGRTIYENLRKFIHYIFSSNIGEIVLIFGAIMLNLPMPLTAILILFVNMTTDVFPAIPLGLEPAEKDIMDKKPRHPKQKILNKTFIGRFMTIGFFIGVITLLAYMWDLNRLNIRIQEGVHPSNPLFLKASTLAFILMVTIELANAFNSRSVNKSIFKMKFLGNIQLILGIVAALVLTIAVVEIPFFQQYFHTVNPDASEWAVIGFCTILIVAVEEIRKWFLNRKKIHLLT